MAPISRNSTGVNVQEAQAVIVCDTCGDTGSSGGGGGGGTSSTAVIVGVAIAVIVVALIAVAVFVRRRRRMRDMSNPKVRNHEFVANATFPEGYDSRANEPDRL